MAGRRRIAEVDMEDASKISTKMFQLLALMFGLLALVLIVWGYFVKPLRAHDIVLGLGVALLPAAVIALVSSYFSDSIMRASMRSDIRKEVTSFRPLLDDAAVLGVDRICATRAEALGAFAPHLREEVRRAGSGHAARLWIVCTTMRGFFMLYPETECNSEDVIRAFTNPNADLRILMLDPSCASDRERQERGAADGKINHDIRDALRRLRDLGVQRESSIRFHPGGVTVFGIATERSMLLNPYPYGTEGHRSFSMIVHPTGPMNGDIYSVFLEKHFEKPWEAAEQVPREYWEPHYALEAENERLRAQLDHPNGTGGTNGSRHLIHLLPRLARRST